MLKLLKAVCIVVLSVALVGIIILILVSPGKTSEIVDKNGNRLPNSIAVIEKPLIGGFPQGIIIRGEDTANAVLLYVHGGPGAPSYSLIKDDLKRLEKIFTICYWEQRGAGMSYSNDIPAATMNLDQLVNDAGEVSRYLIKRFNKQKIYILGHSWGTFLSSFTIDKYPELYHAYIGVGQLGNTYASERESYEFIVKEARSRNDKVAQKEIAAMKFPAIDASGKEWFDYYLPQREYVLKYGGARYGEARDFNQVRKAVLFCREYTIMEKLNFSSGVTLSQENLNVYPMKYDLNKVLPEQKIPVYIFQGLHDHQTSYRYAKEYFDRLKAPVKRFYTFSRSAHSPHLEEYGRFEGVVKGQVIGSSK